MFLLLNFIKDILAVFRLTKLIMEDRITLEFREWYWSKFPSNTKIGYLLTCPWCVSIWAAFIVVGARKAFPKSGDILSTILAASAVTGLAYERGI